MDGAELGRALRSKRKAAGRTVASVAVDAGLSVPYIANLENGRGNPTLSALQKLAEALGTRLDVRLVPEPAEEPEPGEPAAPPDSPRARAVAEQLAAAGGGDAGVVRERMREALSALAAVTGRAGGELTERDLDRFLDLLLLSGEQL